MNIKRILCPVDFSQYNHAANEYASMFAESTGAKIIYLHVFLPSPLETPPEFFDAEKAEQDLIGKMEEFIRPVGDEIPRAYALDMGLAADQIFAYSKEHEIDIIVIGTHGRTGLRRALMGSVAEAVVRRAECPVLPIKSTANVPVQA